MTDEKATLRKAEALLADGRRVQAKFYAKGGIYRLTSDPTVRLTADQGNADNSIAMLRGLIAGNR